MKILFAFLIVQSYLATVFLQQNCPTQELVNGHTLGCSSDGGELQYFCNRGFAVSGAQSRVCVNGSWSGDEPSCQTSIGGASSFADARFDSEFQLFPTFHYSTAFIPACWFPLTLTSASFFCRQIGLGFATSLHRADLDYGIALNGPFVSAQNISCADNATHLSQCSAASLGIVEGCLDGVLGITCGAATELVYNSILDRMQLSHNNTATDLCYVSINQTVADNYCKLKGKLGGAIIRSVNGSKVGQFVIQQLKCGPKMQNFDDCAFERVDSDCDRMYLKIECLETTVENSLRLVGTGDLHTGKLQIYREGGWGDVCWEAFYAPEATVACKQLGFDSYLAFPKGVYGDREGDRYKVERVRCSEGANNFSECEFLPETRCNSVDQTVALWCLYNKKCCLPNITSIYLKLSSSDSIFDHGTVLTYSCVGNTVISGKVNIRCESGVWSSDIPTCVNATENSIRLINGQTSNEGTVQIFYSNRWNFVCDNDWSFSAATKICEELGFNGALRLTYFNYFLSDTQQPFSSLECPDDESTPISNCSINSINCTMEETAGVVCGSLQFLTRLRNGSATEGRAQVYYNGNWLDMCSDFTAIFGTGSLICRKMGFTFYSEFVYSAGMDTYGAATSKEILEIVCFGQVSLEDCPHSLGTCTYPGLYLRCSAPVNDSVRLVGGSTPSEGLVEIYRDYSWRGVCSSGWDLMEGMVLCRELVWPNVSSVNNNFGPLMSYAGFALESFQCFGNETSLSDCNSQLSSDSCDRNDTAAVVCTTSDPYNLRLLYTLEYDRNISGLVEVYVDREWIGICDDGWGLTEASVACLSLGYDFVIEAISNYAIIPTSKGWNYVECLGNETNLGECEYVNASVSSFFFASCYRVEGAGVTCGKYVEYDVKFQEKTSIVLEYQRGVVEVLIDKVWYPICHNTSQDIFQLLCDELGLGELIESYSVSSSNLTTPPLYSINNLTCLVNGMSLIECQPTPGHVSDCLNNSVVGISCLNLDGRVRLVDGNETSGHVQIFYKGAWGDVCDDFWNLPDADVVCRQLGWRGALSANLLSTFGQRGDVTFVLDDVMCVGTESRLVECPSNSFGDHNCLNYELAGVYCVPADCPNLPAPGNGSVTQDVSHLGYARFSCGDSYRLVGEQLIQCLWSNWTGSVPTCVSAQEGDVQLVDGSSSLEGHVQIFHSGRWGYVCDDKWDNLDGEVVCTQLEYAPNFRGISISSFYPNFTNVSQIWLDDVECLGSELQLSDCSGANFSAHNCDGRELAGVECFADEGRLRLTEGNSERNGLLQIYLNGTWHYFCNFLFFGGIGPACSQLGYQDTGFIHSTQVNATNMKSANCANSATYLYPECRIIDAPLCFLNFAANLTCTIDDGCRYRLSKGSYEGVLEFWREGKWGGVCKDGVDLNTAGVICKQLGWPDGATSIGYDVISSGAIPFHYRSVSCSANETDICNCTMDADVSSKCTRDQALTVECTRPADGTLRLAGGNTDTVGILEIFHEARWGTVCDDLFNLVTATVACRQLGFKAVDSYSVAKRILREFWLDDVQCNETEQYLSNCSRLAWGVDNCGSSEGVLLTCTPYAEGELLLTDRKFNGQTLTARVQIRYNQLWYNLCPSQVSNAFANQICIHFNLADKINISQALELNRTLDSSVDSVSLLSCPVDFDNFTECLQGANCPTDKVLGIKCLSFDNEIRLVTTIGYSGVIEINHELSWRGICDDGWDLKDANVACTQLGFNGALRPLIAIPRQVELFWLTHVNCGGDERYLDHCLFQSWAVSNCRRTEYAGVVCKPNDCSTLPIVPNGEFIGNKTHGSVIELKCNVGYVVTGSRVLECVHGEWIGNLPSCILPQELSLRLIGGEGFHEGYVQIFHNNSWGYICDSTWDDTDAKTACIELGFEALQDKTLQSFHGNTTGLAWTDDVACQEGDRSFAECELTFNDRPLNCNGNLAGVTCIELEGNVTLINGTLNSSEYSGWVRIYSQGHSHPVCYNEFKDEELEVVCRQLGFTKGEVVKFGEFSLTYSDLNLNCVGSEDRISECTQFDLSGITCSRPDTYIRCSYEEFGAFRLTGGGSAYEGLLEIHFNTSWSAVCFSDAISQGSKDGICNIMGWEYGAKNISRTKSPLTDGVQFHISSCDVDAKSLKDCIQSNMTCSRNEAIFIECYPPPQNTLRRGDNNALEVFHDSRWGYVCDDLFDSLDANVACYQLGYVKALGFNTTVTVLHSFFWLDNLGCTGSEASLADCSSNGFGFENCYYSEGVTVNCEPYANGDIRFHDEEYPQIYLDNELRYICADNNTFSNQSGDVICLQDGQFSAKTVEPDAIYPGELKPSITTRMLRCTGDEAKVLNCSISSVTSCNSVATLTCIDPTGMIRLLPNGEVQLYSEGWEFICGDRWSSGDGEIACKQLNPENHLVASSAIPAPEEAVFFGTRFDCYGNEEKLADCLHDKSGACATNSVATVACSNMRCPASAERVSCGSRCTESCYPLYPTPACGGCVEKCECFSGYIWNTTNQNVCIPKVDCPNYCTENETYTCVPACQYDCNNYKSILPIFCPFLACTHGCGCKTGYIRKSGIAGECLLEEECEAPTPLPPLNCTTNSRFNVCGSACPSNCSSPNVTDCTEHCVRTCECVDGYVWMGSECIEKDKCPVTTPPPPFCPLNSRFNVCGSACPANCSSPDDTVCNEQCVRTCECVDGYVWMGSECIEKDKCPATTPPPPNCPLNSQFTECGSACPANCSSSDVTVCTFQCVRSCQCVDGYIWLGSECIEKDKCPDEGNIVIQFSTSTTERLSGALQLFSQGNWYNVCSAEDQQMQFQSLALEKCSSLNFQTNEATLTATNSLTKQAVLLHCNDARSFNECTFTLINTCNATLHLSCLKAPIVSLKLGVIVGGAVSVVLAVLIFVVLLIIVLIAFLLVRSRSHSKSYRQFEPKLSVVSEGEGEDAPAITNPIYQLVDHPETEKLVVEDDSAITD